MDHRSLPRVKRSPLWTCSKEEFSNLIARSDSYMDALRHFGLVSSGTAVKTIRQRCIAEKLDISHFDSGNARRLLTLRNLATANAIPLEQVLVQDSTYSRGSLKRRLIASEKLENKCSICGIPPLWNGLILVLRLDHKNGVNNDGRLENLRLVCPNCDSQLPTFSGRNKDYTRRHCKDCGAVIKGKKTVRCQKCTNKENHRSGKYRKIAWPSFEKLKEMIAISNRYQVSKKLGVSETAVRKMLIRMIRSSRPTDRTTSS